jgi:hypothetical protein
MKTNIHVLALALMLSLPLMSNAGGVRVLEDGHEVEARMVTFPSLADGMLSIQGCGACKLQTFKIAHDAQFFVGDIEVTYIDLQRHLRAHPTVALLVVSPKGQLIVTRIRASLPSSKR